MRHALRPHSPLPAWINGRALIMIYQDAILAQPCKYRTMRFFFNSIRAVVRMPDSLVVHFSAMRSPAVSSFVLVLLLVCARCHALPAGTDLQALIDAAKPGDTIVLPAGSVYTGNFTLPKKTGDAVITITS